MDNEALISVIIPVYNGAQTLRMCLEAILRSTYPCYEIIVADDGSTDDSVAIARGFACTVLVAPSHRSAAAARNRAAAYARGELLFFTDADVLIGPDTLERIAHAFDEHPERAAVIGTYAKDTPVPNVASKYKQYHHHWVNQHSPTTPASFFTACGAVRRAVFEQVGFDESWDRCLEDVVFGMDLVSRGFAVYVDRTIMVVHLKQYSVASLIRSDLWNRAVPWTRLLLQRRRLPNELNTTRRDQLAVLLSCLLPIAGLAALVAGPVLPLVTTGSLVLVVLAFLVTNRMFYTFLLHEQTPGFVLRAILLNYVFYLCCGIGVLLALVAHCRDAMRHTARRHPIRTEPETTGSEHASIQQREGVP